MTHSESFRLLFVDDEADFVASMSRALARRGFEVSTAPDGRVCLEVLAAEKYDVILLDVKMPGLDGAAVFREIRRMRIGTPVVMLTGHGSEQQRLELTREGVFEYLAKPCEAELLSRVLRDAVQSGSSTGRGDVVPTRVLVALDESLASLQARLIRNLKRYGIDVVAVTTQRDALDLLARSVFDVLVLGPAEPMAVATARSVFPRIELIPLVGPQEGVLASELMKSGAFDVLDTSVSSDELLERIHAAHDRRKARLDEDRERRRAESLAR